MNRCMVCRRPYYRRNQSISWYRDGKGVWIKRTHRGHPECLRLYTKVAGMFKSSAA